MLRKTCMRCGPQHSPQRRRSATSGSPCHPSPTLATTKPTKSSRASSPQSHNEWTRYDIENATGVNVQIIDRYLARTYHAKEAPDVRLDLMKCLDMYHSAELDAQVKQYVDRPSATYAGDEESGE